MVKCLQILPNNINPIVLVRKCQQTFKSTGVSLTSTEDLICAEVLKFDEWIYFWNISRPLRPLQCCSGDKAVPCGHLAVKGW